MRIYFLAIITGCITGFIGSVAQWASNHLEQTLRDLSVFASHSGILATLVVIIITTLLVFVAWCLVHYLAPDTAGSGIPQVEMTLHHRRSTNWHRIIPVKWISGILAIGSHLVLGREGPTIQIGANVGKMISDLFRIDPIHHDVFFASGAAAGLATAFNAPLAGIFFIIEEIQPCFALTFFNLQIITITNLAAVIVLNLIMGTQAMISIPVFTTPSFDTLAIFFIVGLACGPCGVLFNNLFISGLDFIREKSKPYATIYILAFGILIGYLVITWPDLTGSGQRIIEKVLITTPSMHLLIILLVGRLMIGIMSYSTNIAGGVFMPMLALGTLLGLMFCNLAHMIMPECSIPPGVFAMMGMAGLFSASIRAPLTGIVLIIEITQNYDLIVPLMLTCLTATATSLCFNKAPLYHQLSCRLTPEDMR